VKEFFERLFSSDFMGHGYCYLWKPEIVWLHATSDALITLSYFVIPVALVYFVRKRRDLPFHWVFFMFGIFILGCGSTHLMEIWTLWNGTYRLAGVIKAITAGASVATAVALVPLIPRALLLPSPSQLRAANQELEKENVERRRAEAALKVAHDELELRVQQRTAQLARANEQLQAEILERRHAEDVLRKQASLLELAHDAIVVRGMDDDRITYWNSGAEETYGWLREEALGQVAQELMHSVYPSKLEDLKEEVVREGRWEGEVTQTRRDGRQIVVASRWALQRDEHGKPVAMMHINSDITQRKRADEALQATQAQLAHMARVTTMGELAASIAHEVNQPLTAVVANGNACLRWLAGEEPNLDEAREAVVRIVSEGKRAAEVIQRIRSLLKKSPPQISQLDVNEVVREVLVLTNHEILKKRVSARVELAPGLPAISGDRVQLQQVILNLVMNAVEASAQAGENSHELVVKSEKSGTDQVTVAVTDTGMGIDPDKLDKLFHPFFTTKPNGMGMGLPISRSIIEAHGGRLWAVRNEGSGSTFKFSVPAVV
jgi:two-component system sensor kinase FixL